MTQNIVIAYGDENISLNKGDEHMVLNKEEMSFILKSMLTNLPFDIKIV